MLNTDGLIEHPEPAPYPFGPPDVASILDAGLEDHPGRVALIDGDRTWTWAELDDAVAATAAGIAPGEQLWFAVGNCAEAIIGLLATCRAGGIWIGLPERRASAVLSWLVGRLGPTTLIDSIEAFDALESPLPPPAVWSTIDPGAPAAIAFTSGTSGAAKAVVHSQRNLLWPGLTSVELEPPKDGERIGTPLSLSILNIQVLGPLSALLRGSTYVVMDQRHGEGFAMDVNRFGVTRAFVVPTMLHDLIQDDAGAANLQPLERVIVGGSGANPELLETFRARFRVRPTLSYGLTEAPSGVVRESMNDPIGSGRGFPLPLVAATIRNESGAEVPTGSEGEVCLQPTTSGPWANTWTPTLGYFGEPERTAALFADGVLHTGDTGRRDEDGALSVTGRLSNLIIRGGMNVDPIAIENTIRLLPSIDDVVVLGILDERLGQRVAAVIVPSSKAQLDYESVRTHVLETISKHAVPDVIVASEALLTNNMGKVVRHWPLDLFNDGDTDLRDPAPITTTILRNDNGTLEG